MVYSSYKCRITFKDSDFFCEYATPVAVFFALRPLLAARCLLSLLFHAVDQCKNQDHNPLHNSRNTRNNEA